MTDLLKDKTQKALLSMSIPISIGMLSTFLFQVIDAYFIGQLGANALAALSFASTVYFLMVGLFIGLAVGVSIIIGKATGENDLDKVKSTAFIAILLCLLLSSFLSALGIGFILPIFQFLGATSEILPLIKEYLVPLLAGIPLLTTGIVCGGILRATGNVARPEWLMAIAGVINLFFDYTLILGRWGFPEMGIKGAAFATVFSWVFVILGMFFLLLQDKLLPHFHQLTARWRSVVKEIFELSLPTIITQIISPLTLMYLTILLARQSSLAVAAYGVAGRIETLLMLGILGVSTAITPFIAQNSGAKEQGRIDEAIAFGGKASTYLGLLVALLLFLFIKPMAALFSENEVVIDYTANYFYQVSLSYVFYGLYLITTSIFNGLQSPLNSLKISLIKSLLLTVPLTLLGTHWGVKGIFLGLGLSNVLAGLYAANRMRRSFKSVHSDLAEVSLMNEYKNDLRWLIGRNRK